MRYPCVKSISSLKKRPRAGMSRVRSSWILTTEADDLPSLHARYRYATPCVATLTKSRCPASSARTSPVKKCWRHENSTQLFWRGPDRAPEPVNRDETIATLLRTGGDARAPAAEPAKRPARCGGGAANPLCGLHSRLHRCPMGVRQIAARQIASFPISSMFHSIPYLEMHQGSTDINTITERSEVENE